MIAAFHEGCVRSSEPVGRGMEYRVAPSDQIENILFAITDLDQTEAPSPWAGSPPEGLPFANKIVWFLLP